MNGLKAIEIENFQSIKELIRIEFGQITLLYGPNSAGKSAIYDALELIECLWDPISFDHAKAIDLIARWARREQDKKLPVFLAVEYEINEGDPQPREIWEDIENWKCSKPKTENPRMYYGNEIDEDDPSIFIDGKALVRLEIKINHGSWKSNSRKEEPLITALRIAINQETVFNYDNIDPKTLQYDDEDYSTYQSNNHFLSLYSKFGFHDPGVAVISNSEEFASKIKVKLDFNDYIYYGIFSVNELDIRSFVYDDFYQLDTLYSGISNCASDITFYFGSLLGKILRKNPPIVKADRRVPNPEEALIIVNPELSGWWDKENFSAASPINLSLSIQSNKVDPHYSIIAKFAHAELINRTAMNDDWGGAHASEHLAKFANNGVFLDRMNHHLETNLFTERLYKIKCASTLMVPIDLEEEDPWGYYSLAQPATVRIFLQDGEQRNVELQDVGSGVPFVLPVLSASVSGSIIKIQQPELHLHPALQSSLSDVFIEEATLRKDSLFIIETHSEHLLLRLLRRIRDTEKRVPTAEKLPLTCKDIAIYYFDPQINGGTIVTRQLVTPLGDFYNDWPRGFFAERDADLNEL